MSANSIHPLMVPRYEVIADYPGSLLRIGDILEMVEGPTELWESQRNGGKFLYNPGSYPAIFKRLEWWEHREVSEMPKYVKENVGDNTRFHEADWLELNGRIWLHYAPDYTWLVSENTMCFFEPATEAEYINQNKIVK